MRKKVGNKEKDITEAAIKVFAKSNYHKAKISDIAKEAGIATGSVYLYFENKESIILKIFEDLWTRLYTELEILTKSSVLSPVEKIDAIIDLIFDVFADNPSMAVVFVNEQNNLMLQNEDKFTRFYEKFLDLGIDVLKKGQNEKIISDNIDPQIFRYFVFGAIRNLIHQWARDSEKFPLGRIRRNVKFLTKNGFLVK